MPPENRKQLGNRIQLGKRGEDLAVRYLQENGYVILERNWRWRRREMDIIAITGRLIVFVEVKSRINSPQARRFLFDAITWKKQAHLRGLACCYLRNNRLRLRQLVDNGSPPFRIDVIGAIFDPAGPGETPQLNTLEHLKGAV